MPCLNEAQSIGKCIAKASEFLRARKISGEIIVADNGSSDGSQAIAKSLGARIVDVPVRGYGAALQAGIAAARGEYVIMGDADDSYDFSDPIQFLEKLRAGTQLVMGNRFKGRIDPGAMPLLNKYLGNPVLSFLGRLFFKIPAGDFNCGLRGFSRQAILDLNLRTTGMEFASEMVVRASLAGLSIAEVPTTLAVDGRLHPPHLRPWRDGWRHLRFLLAFSPRWLFLYPGLLLSAIGVFLIGATFPGMLTLANGLSLDVRTMLAGSAALVLGLQSVSFALISRQYATARKLMPMSIRYGQMMQYFTLERLILLGVFIFLMGLAGMVSALIIWGEASFGELGYLRALRLVIVSITALITGGQLILTGFLSGVLAIGQRD